MRVLTQAERIAAVDAAIERAREAEACKAYAELRKRGDETWNEWRMRTAAEAQRLKKARGAW